MCEIESIRIDNEAKLAVDLFKATDQYGFPFYRGKLQFPGTLDLESGVCFMVFVSEEEREQLQISPINMDKRSKSRAPRDGVKAGGKLVIDLHAFTDKTGRIGYVGEVQAPGQIPLVRGLHFTVFTSKKGREEIHIGRLDHRQRREQTQNERNDSDDNERNDVAENRDEAVNE